MSATKVPVKPVPVTERKKPDWKWAGLALLLAAAAIYAPFQLVPFHVFQLTMVLVYAVVLLGLNLLVGHAGQISSATVPSSPSARTRPPSSWTGGRCRTR
ncbi:hypothetical protein ACFQQB_21510 [Nonomuraea rubra]|uniref:hypothetical protein n=1 Tax=Nonomuraea rubra TaxID=46180 RepID=UPI003610DB2C